jgi:hypothetical protein
MTSDTVPTDRGPNATALADVASGLACATKLSDFSETYLQ